MASKGQLTGMTGAFLVAAQLSSRGFIASITSRGAAGADILVTDSECRVAYSVQVKTNALPRAWWVLGNKQLPKGSRSHIYVFVNLRSTPSGDVEADFYVAPNQVVHKIAIQATGENWKPFVVAREKLQRYRDAWNHFKV